MTHALLLPGTPVAYAAPDGLTHIGQVQEYRSDGFVRLQLQGRQHSTHVHERWISDLTPQEQARLRQVGPQ